MCINEKCGTDSKCGGLHIGAASDAALRSLQKAENNGREAARTSKKHSSCRSE